MPPDDVTFDIIGIEAPAAVLSSGRKRKPGMAIAAGSSHHGAYQQSSPAGEACWLSSLGLR